jgi:hypothetical protein
MNFCPSKKILPFLLSKKISSWLIAFVIIWYVSLCVANYFAQRPLWNDEHWVFQSVKDFSPREMFRRTLVQDQTFPRVPLFLIQQISKPFDSHLLALRFLSFISMLAGFFLWVKIAGQQMKEKKEYLTFLLSWCASVPLVYYSAELKQYSMDVFVAAVGSKASVFEIYSPLGGASRACAFFVSGVFFCAVSFVSSPASGRAREKGLLEYFRLWPVACDFCDAVLFL